VRGTSAGQRTTQRNLPAATVLLLCAALGCTERSWIDGPATFSAALEGSGLHDELRALRVVVFDLDEQGCIGPRVERPDLTPLATTGLLPAGTPEIRLDVPAGPRTIYVEVYRDADGLDRFGTGCTETVLSSGERRTLTIRVTTDATTDADADAEADADVADGEDLPPEADGEVGPPTALLITEIDYDQGATDSLEFVELFNPGPAPVSCAGLELWFVSGTSGTGVRYHRQALSCSVIAAGGFHLAGSSARLAAVTCGSTEILRTGASDLIQDGPADAVALIDASGGGAAPIDEVAYDGDIPDWGEGTAAPADDSLDASIQRNPLDRDTGNNGADFHVRATTPCAAP
jgi:hypothetical protein